MADPTYTTCTDQLVSGGVLRIPVPAGSGAISVRRKATATLPASAATVVAYSASVVVTPTPPPVTPAFALADTTLGRIDRSKMSLVSVGNANDLRNLLGTNLTNTRISLQNGDYTGYFEQNAAWTNVEVANDNQKARFLQPTGSTSILLQGSAKRTNIAFTGFNLQSDANSGQQPQLWWNELPQIDGLELSHLDFTCPNGAFNAIGCNQFSTSSQSGSVAKNVWLHDLNIHDVGRVGIELLSQGYDGVFRLFNLAIQNCTFDHLGIGNEYGMAVSLSGLFKQIDVSNNNATRTRRIGYEFVNTQQATATNNNLSNGTDGVGYGFSDDSKGFTSDIIVSGGKIDAPERPFYIYESKNIKIDGLGQPWKGGRGIDMGSSTGCTFKNLDVLIQSTQVESGWQWGHGTANCSATDCKISSAGSVAAGRNPSYEAVVLRNGSHDNSLTNTTTILGLGSNGQPLAGSAASGADGRIVDQGTNNTITNTKPNLAA